MDRRTFLAGCVSLLATPFAAETQEPKTAKIGFLLGGTLSTPSVQIEPFKQTLRERGWVEGQNLTLEYRPAEGHYERLPALVRELVVRGVDVIVTDGTPQTRATIGVTKAIPVVMATTGDPMASGLVSSLAHPGGNLTGASYFLPEINAKRLELLKEAAPLIARVAVVYNPLNSVHEPAVVAIEAVAKTLKLRIQRLEVRAPTDFDAVFPVMTRARWTLSRLSKTQ
jgi:putative tryptophan/tyrosine transport system substrate-binding protein